MHGQARYNSCQCSIVLGGFVHRPHCERNRSLAGPTYSLRVYAWCVFPWSGLLFGLIHAVMQSDGPVTLQLDYGFLCVQKGCYGRVQVEYML